MTSQFIPKSKQQVKPTLLQRLAAGFYIGKLKVTVDTYPHVYHLGLTAIPKYKQFEINLGRAVITFAYRG